MKINDLLHGKKNKHSVKGKILIFKDEFAEEKLKAKLVDIKNIHRMFVVFDKNNNFIGQFNNYLRCHEEINMSTRGIERQLRENPNRENCRKFKAYYIEDIPEYLKDKVIKKED